MTKLYVNTDGDWLLAQSGNEFLLVDDLVTFPATYPATPAPISATISSFSPTYVSITNSLRRQSRSRGAHAWAIELQYGAMTRQTFAPLWAYLISRGGRAKTFTVGLPAFVPLGAATGSPKVNGASQSGLSLITDGWTVSTLILKAGDWVQIENDIKVYSVTSDATSNGSGQVTINIYPALRRVPADNAALSTDPVFTCSLANDVVDINFDQCLMPRGLSLQLQEEA